MDVRIGLDFGTHQTKACLNYKRGNQPKLYEFFQFDTANGPSFFFPSRVFLMKDQTLKFGNAENGEILREYRYFKIASAEDKVFRGVSGFDAEHDKYQLERYDKFSPEILSVLYLAWVIGLIKSDFSSSQTEINSKPKKGLLGKFLNKKEQKQNITYHIQIGIPTEWSEERNLWRRRKFEQILYLACSVLELVNSYKDLQRIPIHELHSRLKELYQYLEKRSKKMNWEEILSRYNLSVFPETAAGLTCLVKEKNLPEGYYSAIDIGGGSSDVSYFRVTSDRKIEYLASESLLIASNDLFDSYSSSTETNPQTTEQAHQYLEDMRINHPFELDKDTSYQNAFEDTFLALNDKYKQIYNERVYLRFRKEIANKKFDEHDCYVYGGGSLVHKPKKNPKKLFRKILIHDNGNPTSLTATRTFAKVKQLGKITLPFEVKPDSWKKFSPLLLGPLGLSNVQPDQSYDWSDIYYEPGEQTNKVDLEDLRIFDLFNRKWVK